MLVALSLFLLYLPAFIANGIPVVVRNLPGLRLWTAPISVRFFGAHKTYRGYISGIMGAGITGILQMEFLDMLPIEVLPLYGMPMQAFFIGAFLGWAALTGDLVKSFVKRRIGIAPGDPMPIFDGIDYVIGAIVAFLPWYQPPILGIIFLLFLAPVLSLVANVGAYIIQWKERWY